MSAGSPPWPAQSESLGWRWAGAAPKTVSEAAATCSVRTESEAAAGFDGIARTALDLSGKEFLAASTKGAEAPVGPSCRCIAPKPSRSGVTVEQLLAVPP